MYMNLENKVVLVTGSSKGIGSCSIKEFAKNKCKVIINYNQSIEEAKLVEEEIKKYNVDYLLIKCDIRKEEEVKEMFQKIENKFNRLDILVNNAAIEINSEFEEKNVLDFRRVLDVNVIGTFLVSKYASKLMLKNKYGKIINITSNNAINKYDPTTLEYDASKAAIISLTHNLAKELSPYINVNAIAPGWVKTKKIEKINNELNGLFEESESANIFKGRFATEEEIANVILFLASDLSSYINNEVIKVDGGTI